VGFCMKKSIHVPTNSMSNVVCTSKIKNVITVRIFVVIVTSRTIKNIKMHRRRLESVHVIQNTHFQSCFLLEGYF
jgi:hypothetical protein